MASPQDIARELAELLPAHLADLALEVDDVAVHRSGRQRVLDVTLDADGGVDLDLVASASHRISQFLDDRDFMGPEPYVLEVSSRGVGTPLTKPAHWRRNVGRLVAVAGDSINATGRLTAFEDPIATLVIKGQTRTVDIGSISRAVVDVEFTRSHAQEGQ